MTRKEIKEMKKRWREALTTPTKPLHDPVPLGEIMDKYLDLEGEELCEDCSRINKPNPYYDCISRQNAIDAMWEELDEDTAHKVRDILEAQPSVMPEQEHCEDCISRQAVLALKTPVDTMTGWSGYMIDALDVEQLPSIQPKPKTGHWKKLNVGYGCSECSLATNKSGMDFYRFCPNCGAKMESEEENERRNSKV